MRRWNYGLCIFSSFFDYSCDIWDYFSTSLDPDVVVELDIFGCDKVDIMETYSANRDAGQLHWFKIGDWCDDPATTYLSFDTMDLCTHLLGWEFICHSSTWMMLCGSEYLAIFEFVDFDDKAIEIIVLSIEELLCFGI